ncbi:cytoskeletal protein CcmA (bactofilin family) [Anaerosolibacter carboniphilus]|uniref:Cytoskeletal protein CcmA (Bactofilin family) n=1 Tax=Anaerosolibacter carboniphilus TaxID=1417629 RepID=A0A841KPE9_9FIRM|nr:polymer-forming cytoskeletal protein [Anaerosolibacter carboniphilus]MBB6215654.1 cytoskeletal protein CcmA (bactofilin family) [Anaerosolibacter carboniphilus]
MFKKSDSSVSQIERFDTLIGTNSNFEGKLTADGTIRIDGHFQGDIFAKGNVFIGEEGKVLGNITAKDIYNSGTIEGNVTALGQLKITSTGNLFGDIHVASFVVEEKAIFEGKCSMKDASQHDEKVKKLDIKKANA